MDQNFHYNVVPNPGRPNVSTRVAPQADLTQAEIVAAVAASTGLTPAQVIACGTALFREVIIGGRASRNVRRLFGLYTFRPSCGGTHPDSDFQPTVDSMNLALRGALAPDGDALFADGITFQRDAVLGEKAPHVIRVLNVSTGELDKCFSGGAFRISGSGFGPEPALTSTTLGVFLAPADGSGTPLRVQGYSEWTDTEITGSWPAGIPGDSRLTVTTHYPGNTSPSSDIYPTVLVNIP